MLAVLDIHRPATTELDPAGEVIGRAFADDPGWVFVLPDADHRTRHLGWLGSIAVRYGQRFGEVFASGSPVNGISVWLPPGETGVTADRLDEVGFAAAPARLGREAFDRFARFTSELAVQHARLVPDPHWYLMLLAVDPMVQRQGAGSLLLEPVLERADRRGVPCYLETARERSLWFYRKHGFELVRETSAQDLPPVWHMVRSPRGS
jgi:GNAT superfamily N-acetyltransferase